MLAHFDVVFPCLTFPLLSDDSVLHEYRVYMIFSVFKRNAKKRLNEKKKIFKSVEKTPKNIAIAHSRVSLTFSLFSTKVCFIVLKYFVFKNKFTDANLLFFLFVANFPSIARLYSRLLFLYFCYFLHLSGYSIFFIPQVFKRFCVFYSHVYVLTTGNFCVFQSLFVFFTLFHC